MFITISKGAWVVSDHADRDFTFPISGEGMKAFFQARGVEGVCCSSSIDFPADGGSTLTAAEAEAILNDALDF